MQKPKRPGRAYNKSESVVSSLYSELDTEEIAEEELEEEEEG